MLFIIICLLKGISNILTLSIFYDMQTKTLLILLFSFFSASWVFAQSQTDLEKALRFIEQNKEDWGLAENDVKDLLVNDSYVSKHNGVRHFYFIQTINNIPVYNALLNIVISKNGKAYMSGNRLIPEVHNKNIQSLKKLNAEDAIKSAFKELGIDPEGLTLKSSHGENEFVFTSPVSAVEIPAKLIYTYDQENSIELSWDLSVKPRNSSDYWSVRLSTMDGRMLDKLNWTVYCNVDHNRFKNHRCETNVDLYHAKSVLEELSTTSFVDASYKVYPQPAESPNHGDHEVVTSPHDLLASPFGWHDTDGVEGAEFTITRGNNVHAYLDQNGTDTPSKPEPDGGPDLQFIYEHDQLAEPNGSEEAAQVNLFYFNNIMHDFTYHFGFDEAAGNFQQTNYSGEGNGGDYVWAHAQDGSGTNNANFSTPPDGGNGVMQMFLWEAGASGLLNIQDPEPISGIYETATADFGANILNNPIAGEVVIAMDDSGDPLQCCYPIINETELTGKVALINRGGCEFGSKVLNAETHGAIAALICNVAGVNGGNGEELNGMAAGSDGAAVTIPSVMIQKSTCDLIRATIQGGTVVSIKLEQPNVSGPQFLDASFDNGVIAHEYGHGISNRLTGGPGTGGCLGNDEQMGEGWSDFFSLVTTVQPGDVAEQVRGIGTYVTNEDPDGHGIRTFPYSTDMSINPHTFSDIIGTTAPHPLGEVWTTCTWDLYWALVDLYGWDPDLSNTESGNFKAIQLVMDGMKLQPCSPGFVDGRDAILLADELNFEGAHQCLIWEVFARRGLGYYADQGSSNSRNDGIEDFEPYPFCIETLKMRKSAPDFIVAGEDVNVEILVYNHKPEAVENIVVVDEIPQGLSYKDGSASMAATVDAGSITFDLGTMEFLDSVTISYTLESDPDNYSLSLYKDDMENGDNDWELTIFGGAVTWDLNTANPYSGSKSWTIGYSDQSNDHAFETKDPFVISGNRPVLRFFHDYNANAGSDGGFVQVRKADNPAGWTLVNDKFLINGYPSSLAYGGNNAFAIPSLEGFSGKSNGYIASYVDLSEYIGEEMLFRFRFGTGTAGIPSGANPGWSIDDFELIDLKSYTAEACVTGGDSEMACDETITLIDALADPNSTNEINHSLFNIQLLPNPADEQVSVDIQSKLSGQGIIELLNNTGTVLQRQVVSLPVGSSRYNLNTAEYPEGMYFVRIVANNQFYTKKLFLQ